MALINRIEDFVKSEFNALLDKSECPSVDHQTSYRELEAALASCRELAAKLICERKVLQRRIDCDTDAIQDWYEKAQYAVEKQRDDLARAALEEKHKCEQSIEQCHLDLNELSTALEKVESDISTLQQKIRSVTSQKDQPVREGALMARLKVKEILNNPSVQDLCTQFEMLERKLFRAESKSDCFEFGADSQRNKTQQAFNELLKNEKVESMLKSLKGNLSSTPSQKSTAN
ncbi:hypothetical protein A7985_17975 [Pseudoalteromonas luteoviolacea]|uniref:Phage shock protein A n=1 Tax=Pseudoalteromonas luteoviolacea TaxID=43657 RepID=A0A1C0TN83_9GAMM|nr:PspA/IM30 family protein [Pseudoalteromonas luteoviolacea]OCQ20310.1 hypothetical protein A7985_17975 [Pseudoalteromonas luteoviolacea]